jgi:hypothetical protein
MSAAQIKTQLAQAAYSPRDGQLQNVNGISFRTTAADTPVLVVPLANVKGCKHEDSEVHGLCTAEGSVLESCANCGAMRWNNKRWTPPRVLRVGR